MDNIPSEVLKNGGEATTSPDRDMPEDLGDKGMAEGVGTILVIRTAASTNVRTILPLA